MAIKVGIGKWPEAAPLIETFEAEVHAAGFTVLPITIVHVRHAGLMPFPHRDPFDRLIVAQADIENLMLVTADERLRALDLPHIW